VAASSLSSRWLAGAARVASGIPVASMASDRLRPCLRRSVGLGPATWPPQGALVMQPVHHQVLQFQAEHAVVGGQHRQAELVGHPGGDPLVTAAAQRGRRAGGVGDAPIAAAEHQDLDELVEDDAVGDAGAVAAQRMVDSTSGEEGGDLDPQRFQDRRWQGRHETSR
jgi:hypothetical protein